MRVLLAEADRELVAQVAGVVQRQGHQIVLAHDGVEALQRWLADQPQLVLLDAGLSQLGGLDLCKLIRLSSRVPIIIFMASDREDDVIRAYEAGVDDCIVKPFGVRQLELRLQTLLRRLDGPPAPRLAPLKSLVVVGDLVIDSSRMQVHKNKRRVAVTPLEFGILHLLAGNAGTVVAADQLLHEVWQADVGDSVARVKVHLSHLRQKLQEAGGKPLVIRALPRVGYMLMVPRTHTRTAVRQTTGHQSATPLPMLDDGERSSSLIERGEGDLITRFRAATGSGGQ